MSGKGDLAGKKGRIPVHRPGTRHTDKKKEASKRAARQWAKRRFEES